MTVAEETRLLGDLRWGEFADGRVHRLKRGRHFSGTPKALATHADRAAATMGKAVRVVVDDMAKVAYLWVQFADQELVRGEPCACGGTTLDQVHEHFARCPECGRTAIVIKPAPRTGDKVARSSLQYLSGYDDVELVRDEQDEDPDRERFFARAVDVDETEVLLVVDYPLHDGERIPDPAAPEQPLHSLKRLEIEPFARALELGLLEDVVVREHPEEW